MNFANFTRSDLVSASRSPATAAGARPATAGLERISSEVDSIAGMANRRSM